MGELEKQVDKGSKEDNTRLFSVVPIENTRSNELK